MRKRFMINFVSDIKYQTNLLEKRCERESNCPNQHDENFARKTRVHVELFRWRVEICFIFSSIIFFLFFFFILLELM